MTFSQSVKSEILKYVRNVKGCCKTAFLTAVLKSIGSLSIEFKKFSFEIESDNHEFLSVCSDFAASEYGCNGKIESCNVNAKGAAVYSCNFDGNIGEKLGLTERDKDGLIQFCQDTAKLIPASNCCKRSFLQGLFVACGSVAIPVADTDIGENTTRSKYHLELRFADSDFAEQILSAYSDISFRSTIRKAYKILYLKDSERIADFLVYINAMKGKLKLENVIIGRSMRNNANRQSNCISANIEKAVVAAEKQLAAISALKNSGVYDSLPVQLKEIAELRNEYPEATLDEIAAKLKISKSGANHRFTKIIDIANSKGL